MDKKPHELYDEVLVDFLENIKDGIDLTDEDASTAMKNFETFSKCRPPEPEPVPTPVVPETKWEKFKLAASRVWDNETTRVVIKAGGAFAGVAVVAYSTIHKDAVLERQALGQANQRNS